MPLSGAYINPQTAMSSLGVPTTYSLLHKQSWTDPATLDDNGFLAAIVGRSTAGSTAWTLDGALVTAGVGINDFARNIIVTVTHASSVVAGTVLLTGTDIFGNVITETVTVAATGTSQTAASKKAFKTLTNAVNTVAADASGNTYIIGNGDVLGLDAVCCCVSPVKELEDAAAPTAGVLVEGVAAHATADPWGTYDPNSALNGALDFQIWYIVDDYRLTNAASQRGL